MARKARVKAQSGIYRVVLRSDKMIFASDADASVFLNVLLKEKEADFIEIYAYCLLNQEIHIVLKEGLSGISANMMRICSKYVADFNARNNASGNIFKGRFVSFALEDNEAVLGATKLVHLLPVGIGLDIDYEFSSYSIYFKKSPILDTDAIFALAGSIIDFKLFTESGLIKRPAPKFILSDGELKRRILQILKEYNSEQIESMDKSEQKKLLNQIKNIEGAELDAIARILGMDIDEINGLD